jgi:ABC-type spermidine/putrescine transport system permease subunit II
MIIWSMLKRGVSPALNALSTILLVMTFVLLVIALRVFNVKIEL